MATVLGAASSATGLLEAAARLISRIRKAHDRQKGLVAVLERHTLEIESVNTIARAILDEDELQTAAIASELLKLQVVGTRLVSHLKRMEPGGKGVARQLAYQLANGTRDEETLADVMDDLTRVKANLSLRMQLANVGLIRMVRETVIGSVEAIKRVDCLLVDVLGSTQGLKLAGLVTDTVPNVNSDFVPLRKVDIAALEWNAAEKSGLAVEDDGSIDRVIIGNTAQDSAIQLLGPVGKDLWEDMRVQIEGNTARDDAIQLAYPIDVDAFKHLLDARTKTMAIGARYL